MWPEFPLVSSVPSGAGSIPMGMSSSSSCTAPSGGSSSGSGVQTFGACLEQDKLEGRRVVDSGTGGNIRLVRASKSYSETSTLAKSIGEREEDSVEGEEEEGEGNSPSSSSSSVSGCNWSRVRLRGRLRL